MHRESQFTQDMCSYREKSLKRPRLVAPSAVQPKDPPVLLRCQRPVAMMDMDFMPRDGEMTLMSDTGCTHVLRLSDKALRVFLGDSICLRRLPGEFMDTVMCTSAGSSNHRRVNATATGHFGKSVAGGVVRGSVVLVRENDNWA